MRCYEQISLVGAHIYVTDSCDLEVKKYEKITKENKEVNHRKYNIESIRVTITTQYNLTGCLDDDQS